MNKEKITHEQMRKTMNKVFNSMMYYFNDSNAKEFEKKLETYIVQQEKQEKLLELYKEQLTLSMPVAESEEQAIKYFENKRKIKELENE